MSARAPLPGKAEEQRAEDAEVGARRHVQRTVDPPAQKNHAKTDKGSNPQ
jgi:hypothetical protein